MLPKVLNPFTFKNMSQLAKAILHSDTGERKHIPKGLSPLFQDVFDMREDWHTTYTPDVAKVYRIGVSLGSTATVPEHSSLKDSSALPEAIRRTKEQIIEAVFGEFRQDFRRIEKAIYDFKYEEAGQLLYQMERKMFGDE